MLSFAQQRSFRILVLALGVAIYLAFVSSLVSQAMLEIPAGSMLLLVGIWCAGLLLCSLLPQTTISNVRRLALVRLTWLNVGGVIAAALVDHELRYLMLVVPVFGVLYGSLRLSRIGLVMLSGVTWVCYVLAVLVLLTFGNADPYFELLSLVAFSCMLAGAMLFAADVAVSHARLRQHQSELHRSLEAASAAATQDELTGAYNRRFVMQALARQQAMAVRGQLHFTVVYCDLDHFKQVNDAHGHAAGDEVLKTFAHVAGSLVRSMDYVARIGGEEFLLVLVGASETIAWRVASRLCERMRSLEIPLQELKAGSAEAVKVTVSCGVAMWRDNESIEDLLVRADQALYQAKRNGRDRVVLAG